MNKVIYTGLSHIDEFTKGLKPGELCLLGTSQDSNTNLNMLFRMMANISNNNKVLILMNNSSDTPPKDMLKYCSDCNLKYIDARLVETIQDLKNAINESKADVVLVVDGTFLEEYYSGNDIGLTSLIIQLSKLAKDNNVPIIFEGYFDLNEYPNLFQATLGFRTLTSDCCNYLLDFEDDSINDYEKEVFVETTKVHMKVINVYTFDYIDVDYIYCDSTTSFVEATNKMNGILDNLFALGIDGSDAGELATYWGKEDEIKSRDKGN